MEIEEVIVNDNEINVDNSIEKSNDETSDKDNSQDNSDEEATYKIRYADSSREGKRITQVHSAYRQVLKDNSHLLELDKKLAKDVVKQLYEDGYASTDSVEDLIKAINGETVSDDKPLDKDELRKEIKQAILDEQQEEEAEKAIDDALSSFDNETRELFLEEFKEIAGDRKLTPKFAKKEMDKIIVYYNREQAKKDRNDEALSNLASNGVGKSKSTSSSSMTLGKLDSLGMPKSQQRTLYPELFTK